MMGQMRNMAKWVLYILIFAFLGLMVFEWGADGSMFQGTEYIGEIEGRQVTLSEYREAVQLAYDNERYRTGQEVDQERATALRNQIWERLIRDELLQPQIEKLNIRVSNADITNFIYNNPPPDIRGNDAFKTNGIFDVNKYKQLLGQQENRENLVYQENLLRAELPYIKLEDLVSSAATVTEPEIREEFMAQSTRASLDFLLVPLSSFRDNVVEVSESDIADFYQKNREDYQVPEKRKVNYVSFSTAPTAADSQNIQSRLQDLAEELRKGADFGDMAVRESDDPSAQQNRGDLGFFDRNAMVKPFADAAYAASIGQIVGPIETRFGYHIIRVEDKTTENGVEKVKASHILKNIEASYETRDLASSRANDFLEKIDQIGFSKAADELGLEIKQSPEFVESPQGAIPGAGQVGLGAVTWSFTEETGATSRIYDTPNSYVLMELAEIFPEGYRPLKEVEAAVKNRLEADRRRELTMEYGRKIAPQVQGTASFADLVASSSELTLVSDTTGWFPKKAAIPKIGRAPGIAAAAFSLPVGQLSAPIQTDRGTFFIRVRDRQDFDENDYAAQRNGIRNRLLQQKQRTTFQEWYNQLKEDADIKDYRYKYFTI